MAISINENVSLTDADSCQPDRCPDYCDPQEDCVVAAVSTMEAAGTVHLYTNLGGGDPDLWVDVPVTEWATDAAGASAVLCIGEFLVMVNTAETAIIYSDDRGTTRTEIDQAVVTDWVSNPPVQIDGIDQTFVVLCGNNGYVYGSYDAGRSWETLDAGIATTAALSRVMIARDNPSVVYAIGATDKVIKSINGGHTWALVTPTGGGAALTALWVVDQNTVLVGDASGNIYETEDGGVVWTAQADPPSLPATASINDIVGCGCGILWMVVEDKALYGTDHVIYRNIDGGADGRWFIPTDGEDVTHPLLAITCCDRNRAVAVGGTGTTQGNVVLLT